MDQNSAQIDNSLVKEKVTSQKISVKVKKRSKTLILIGVIFSLIIVTALSLFFYNKSLQSRIAIPDQSVTLMLHIDKLVLKKNSFLVITVPSSNQAEFLSLQYFKAGVYEDFDTVYATDSINFGNQNTQTARAYIYEDSNSNEVFDRPNDKMLSGFLNKPIFRKFNISKVSTNSLSCSLGFNEDFTGVKFDQSRWVASVGNKIEAGALMQSADMSTAINQDATVLYTKQKFSGDILINADMLTFQVDGDGPATSEVTLFTENDRVLNVSFNKMGNEYYITYALSKQGLLVQERQVLPSFSPVNLRIERKGTVGKILNGDKLIWEIPNISSEDVYLGVETYNRSQSPNNLSSSFDNISISCPK